MKEVNGKRIVEWDDIVIDELNKYIAEQIKAREIIFCCMLGSLVRNCKPASFNLIIHSASSSGKDYVVGCVGRLFSENYIHVSRMSPTTFNYWHTKEKEPDWNWDGKIIHLEDISEVILNHEVMKTMTSGETRAIITIKNEAKELEVKGKPVIIVTTATSIPSKEILNRFSVVKLDESHEQIKVILKFRGEKAKDSTDLGFSFIVKEHISKLKSYGVSIPFANKISEIFPCNELRENRNIDRLFDFIKASAIFHQDNREKLEGEWIVATLEDYEIAKNIFENLYSGVSEFPLNKTQRKIVNLLEEQENPLTAIEILQRLGDYIAIQNFRPHLAKLVNIEVLDAFEERGIGNIPTMKYNLSNEFKEFKPIKLPDGIDLEENDKND